MVYSLDFVVRDYECDLQGIVNNANKVRKEPLRVILPTTSNIFDQIQFYEDLYDDIFPRIDERCNLLTTIKEELQTVLYNLNSLKNSNNQQTLNKVAVLE